MDTTSTAMAASMYASTAEHAGLRQMREMCERYDNSMRDHYQWLTRQVVQFQQDKMSLLEQTQRNAHRGYRAACSQASSSMYEEDVSTSIQAMMPASLRHLLVLVLASQDPVEEDTVPEQPQELQQSQEPQQSQQYTGNAFQIIDDEHPEPALPLTPTSPTLDTPTPPSTIHQCEPTTVFSFVAARHRSTQPARPSQPRRSRKPSKPRKAKKPNKPSSLKQFMAAPRPLSGVKPGSGSGKKLAAYFTNKTVAPAENCFSQLMRDSHREDVEEPLPALKNKEPWLEPVLPPIDDWEVEATEYVFEYEPFGPGWFVLRCDRGMDLAPVKFTSYPLFKNGHMPGLTHFRDEGCKHHEHKAYTEETMMVAYARRVVDNCDADVTAEWAAESNENLAETAQRRKQKNARRREKKKGVCVKNEPRDEAVIWPREDWSKSGGGSCDDPMFLDDEDADCDDGEEIYNLSDDDEAYESSQSSESANDEVMEDDSDEWSI